LSIVKRHISSVPLLLVALISPAFAQTKSPIQERADRFLALVNAGYQAVYRVNSEAQWTAVTDVTPEHDAAAEQPGKRMQHSMATLRSSPKRANCSHIKKN
jgi:site-specific DNA-adenine methylase